MDHVFNLLQPLHMERPIGFEERERFDVSLRESEVTFLDGHRRGELSIRRVIRVDLDGAHDFLKCTISFATGSIEPGEFNVKDGRAFFAGVEELE